MASPEYKTFPRHSSPDRTAGATLWVFASGARGIIKLRLPIGDGKAITLEFEATAARSVVAVLNRAIRDWDNEFGSEDA